MPDPNRFQQGRFAPVEEITAFDVPVTGALPAALNGRYLRNGPNPRGAAAGRQGGVVPQPLGPLPAASRGDGREVARRARPQ